MQRWRELLLRNAIDAGFLSDEEAETIDGQGLDDAGFIDAIFAVGAETDAEMAAIRALIGAEVLSSVSNAGVPKTWRRRSAPIVDGILVLEGLPNTYQLVREIGHGGMGIVYEAYEPELDRRVAIKVAGLRDESDTLSDVLHRERTIVSALDHAHIVTVLGAGQLADGRPYYVMPLIVGVTLDCWAGGKRRSQREIASLMRSVARAVGTAHELSVVHRDLSPRNVMVTADGQPKVLDFGLASGCRVENDDSQHSPEDDNPFTGRIVGTRGYMSPEQRDGRRVAPPSDVYSLGILLANLLSERKEVPCRQTRNSLASTGADGVFVAALPCFDGELRAIIAKCLAERPSERYAAASKLADDLDRWLTRKPVEAYRGVPYWYPLRKLVQRHPWTTAATIALILAAVIAPASIVQQGRIADLATAEKDLHARLAQVERDRADAESLRDGIAGAIAALDAGRVDEALASLGHVPQSRRRWEWHRLWYEAQLMPVPRRVIVGHEWGVLAILLSPDGRTLISSGADGCVTSSDTSTALTIDLARGTWTDKQGRFTPALNPADSPDGLVAAECYFDMAWIEPGKSLVAVSQSGRVCVWELPASEPREIVATGDCLTAVASSDKDHTVLIGSRNGRLLVTDQTGRTIATRELSNVEITDTVSLPDGWGIAQQDGSVRILSPDLSAELSQWDERGAVFDMDYCSATRQLAIAADTPAITIVKLSAEGFAIADRRSVAMPDDGANAKPMAPHSVRWSNDGTMLLAGDSHGRLIAWDTETWQVQLCRKDQAAPSWKTPDQAPARAKRATAAIAALAADRIYTAGRDGTVKQWNAKVSANVRQFQAGEGARIAFGPDGDTLWSLDGDGRLVLWNTHMLTEIASVNAGDTAERGSLAATRARDVVAVARGMTIGVWRSDGSAIHAVCKLGAPAHVAALAIASDGSRVAAYLTDDTLAVWNVPHGELVSRKRLVAAGLGAAREPLLRFTADDSRLVVAARGLALSVIGAESLEVVERPSVFAGDGGTALDCDPVHPDRFVGGDTVGRIHVYPERRWPRGTDEVLGRDGIAALAFTPDGQRVAAVKDDGQIAIIEPQRLGAIWTARATVPSVATAMEFDPTGACLAIVHVDGVVELWDTAALQLPPAKPRRNWKVRTLLDGPHARQVVFRDASVALDSAGQPLVAFSRRTGVQHNDETAEHEIVLGHCSHGSFDQTVIESAGALSDRHQRELHRTLACAAQGGQAFTAFRRPRNDLAAGAGQLVVHELTLPPPADRAVEKTAHALQKVQLEGDPVSSPGNDGFANWLIPQADGELAVLHFSHHDRRLRLCRRQDGKWHSAIVGQQGDGLHLLAAASDRGKVLTYFRPSRYDGDQLPLVCLAIDQISGESVYREVPDNAADMTALSVTVDRAGQPALLYSRGGERSALELVVARRDANGVWKYEVIAHDPNGRLRVSNLAVGNDGFLQLATLDMRESGLDVHLFTQGQSGWSRELVWTAPPGEAGEQAEILVPVLRINPAGRPLILVGQNSLSKGWLRLIESAE